MQLKTQRDRRFRFPRMRRLQCVREQPELAISEELRASALELSAGLKDASSRVMFELALLQTEMAEGKVDTAGAVKRLSTMDAAMMAAVAALADVVDQLEKAKSATQLLLTGRKRCGSNVAITC